MYPSVRRNFNRSILSRFNQFPIECVDQRVTDFIVCDLRRKKEITYAEYEESVTMTSVKKIAEMMVGRMISFVRA